MRKRNKYATIRHWRYIYILKIKLHRLKETGNTIHQLFFLISLKKTTRENLKKMEENSFCGGNATKGDNLLFVLMA